MKFKFPPIAIRKGLKLFDVRIDPQIKLNWWWKEKMKFKLFIEIKIYLTQKN
jgi:hypothetical protein